MDNNKNEFTNQSSSINIFTDDAIAEKYDDIRKDLDIFKNSFVNDKELNNNVDFLKYKNIPDLNTIMPALETPIPMDSEKEVLENEAIILPYIFLTESGFSTPVGTFDPVTRIAKLTTNIIDKTLIIMISNVTLNGNHHFINNTFSSLDAIYISAGLEQVTIKNLDIKTNGFGIFLGDNTIDITIECNKISASIIGITSNLSKNLTVEHNEINNSILGIALLDRCSYSTISKNTMLNNNNGILLNLRNSFTYISKNKIIVTKSYSDESGIVLNNYNSYNTIEKNIIRFSNRKFELSQDSVVFTSSAIFISDTANTMISINENLIEFNNNTFNFTAKDINYKVSQIQSFENNSKIVFTKNKCVLMNNTFNINAENSIEIRQANLFNIKNTANEIIENTFINQDNNVNYLNNNVVSIKSYFTNLRFDDSNYSALVSKNKFFNLCNSINPSQDTIKRYDIILSNISINSSNQVIDIMDNILQIQNDTVFTAEVSIYIAKDNYGIGVTKNIFKNSIRVPVILSQNNYGNVVTKNIMENVAVAGVILDTNNGLNIIEENVLENVEFFGIVLIDNNDSNLISKNYIANASVGMLFLLSTNEYNNISKNIFCKNFTDISIPNNSFNYVFKNINKCLIK